MANHGLNARDSRKKRKQLRERDGDNCYICHQLMDFNDPFIANINTNPHYATIEHIIKYEVSKSNKLSNLALSHYKCNTRRNYK